MDKLNESSDSDEPGEHSPRVKEEPRSDTIKNYAENTMNELLGLFGYDDKVNSADTESLNLDNYADSKENGSDVTCDGSSGEKGGKPGRKPAIRLTSRGLADHTNLLAQQHMNLVTALKRREQAELAERSSEAAAASERDGSSSSSSSTQCAWCKKPGTKQLSLETSTGVKLFCSEVCFTQCRRASFKKSKVCDWCKHVRHTVNYVEFTDGEAQLQFCSEKCLNQYKMSIFCKETQEHLHALTDKGDDSSSPVKQSDKSGEKSILITPELWMNGENARRAAAARETALDRMSLHRHEDKEGSHRSHSSGTDKLKLRVSEPKGESARLSLIERIKSEANMKNKRTLVSRESDRSSSPARSEPASHSPQPQSQGQGPSPFPHPSGSGMMPWFQHAQMLGQLPPGLPPLPGYQQFMVPGFFPGGLPTSRAPEASPQAPQERDADDKERRSVKKEAGTHNSRLLSPSSGRSSTSDPTSNANEPSSTPRSPGLHERRTSSLFPVDFPQMFPNGPFPGAPLQAPFPGMPGARFPPPQLPGMPPPTVMLPFPVILPMPVPVPVPIPLTVDTLMKHFNKTTSDTSGKGQTSDQNAGLRLNVVRKVDKGKEPQLSPHQLSLHSPQSVASTGSEISSYDRHDVRSRSRGSCPDLSRHAIAMDNRLTVSEPKSYKRSRTPDEGVSLDLSKHSKIARYEYSDSNDGVIDLSAPRDNGHRSDESCSESSFVNGHVDNEDKNSSAESETVNEEGAPVPKIHIITHKDETPLNQPLPLPPVENSYSNRRGLILDAPSVPKKSKSPSPERRIYVRNVPRDLIEAARRRCLRTRIRTK